MLNFTVGPVMMSQEIREIGYDEVPYFRTDEFSNIMIENEYLFRKSLNCNNNEKMITLTGSGTLAMEAVILNTLTKDDKILIINGGSFGRRFVEICETYDYKYDQLILPFGENLTKDFLDKFNYSGYTALVVNLDETSSGVLYDLELINNFCIKNDLFLIVDAISSYLADTIDMSKHNIDALIVGSQKALALPPGISIVLCSEKALCRIRKNDTPVYYMDFKKYLKNMERGQTPFTPAVSIILQLNQRLLEINELGTNYFINKSENLAEEFRYKITDLGCKLVTTTSSNAVTAFYVPKEKSAKQVFQVLKDEYGIWITPSGGKLSDKVLRVGHIGNITEQDMKILYEAFDELKERGIL